MLFLIHYANKQLFIQVLAVASMTLILIALKNGNFPVLVLALKVLKSPSSTRDIRVFKGILSALYTGS